MTENKGFFRNVLDAIVESRSREAARELALYHDFTVNARAPSRKR